MGPTAGLDDMETKTFLNLPGLELRPLDRSASSQSLYRLRYRGPSRIANIFKNRLIKKTEQKSSVVSP
jgi:hypothetical protein